MADDRPLYDLSLQMPRRALRGYWYCAIRHSDEDPKALDPDRFAFCAFPARPGDPKCKYMFVIDENNTVFRCLAKGRGRIAVFPTEEEMKADWNKLD
jgi:hypothetical protein